MITANKGIDSVSGYPYALSGLRWQASNFTMNYLSRKKKSFLQLLITKLGIYVLCDKPTSENNLESREVDFNIFLSCSMQATSSIHPLDLVHQVLEGTI